MTKTNRLLVLVIVMQALMLAGQWLNSGMLSTASAQVPNGGAQRQETIDELKAMNSKLDRIAAFLESGKLEVHTVAPDEKK